MDIPERKFDSAATKADYKKIVWFYDIWSRLTESKAAKYVLEYAEIKDGEAVLEVACGTGVVFEEILKRNPHGKNTGIDLSPEMLDKARKRVKNLNGVDFELREGDALALDFDDNTFDLLINNFMVDLMPVDAFDVIAGEFYRVLKPDGRVVVSTFSFGKKKVHKFWFWLAKRFPGLLTGCRPVSFKEHLVKAGFKLEKSIDVSQNTFPSEVIKAIKRADTRKH